MRSRPDIEILLYDAKRDTVRGCVASPRKLTIRSGFGAMPRRCWLELFYEDLCLPVSLGDWMTVRVRDVTVFSGRVAQLRIRSCDDPLSLYAEWNPERAFDRRIEGVYEEQTLTQILVALCHEAGLTYSPQPTHAIPLQRFEFEDFSLIAAIDLFAKLAGNWRWDLLDDGELRFRPIGVLPDHFLPLSLDASSVNVWKTTEDVFTSVEINAGLIQGEATRLVVDFPDVAFRSEADSIRIFARPISSWDGLAALRRAIRQQMKDPRYSRTVDLLGVGESVMPGDSVRFTCGTPPRFPEEALFRVREREIVYERETVRTRLHLTSAFESAPTYFHYLKKDRRWAPPYQEGRMGMFQLDVSALDSSAHLDAA